MDIKLELIVLMAVQLIGSNGFANLKSRRRRYVKYLNG